MLRRWSPRLSYANVVATMALFVALGGASYAAVVLPADSVGSRELKRRAVGSAELQPGAVTSAAVKDFSLRRRDLALDDFRGPVGPAGPAGPSGPRGEVGPTGPSQLPPSAWGFTGFLTTIGEEAQVLNVDRPRLAMSSGALTVSEPSRIFATAPVVLLNPQLTVVRGACRLEVAGTITGLSGEMTATVPAATDPSQPSGYGRANLSVVGMWNVDPGSYDIALRCHAVSSDTGETVVVGNRQLLAWAVAR